MQKGTVIQKHHCGRLFFLVLVAAFHLACSTAAPIQMSRRDTVEGQSSMPFWVSAIACTGALVVAIALAIAGYLCFRAKRRRQQTSRDESPSQSTEPENESHHGIVGRDSKYDEEKPAQGEDRAPPGAQLAAIFLGENSHQKETQSAIEPAPPKGVTKKKTASGGGGTWKMIPASLGRKSVASVQWVSFRASMDNRPKNELCVVNSTAKRNSSE